MYLQQPASAADLHLGRIVLDRYEQVALIPAQGLPRQSPGDPGDDDDIFSVWLACMSGRKKTKTFPLVSNFKNVFTLPR